MAGGSVGRRWALQPLLLLQKGGRPLPPRWGTKRKGRQRTSIGPATLPSLAATRLGSAAGAIMGLGACVCRVKLCHIVDITDVVNAGGVIINQLMQALKL